MSVSSSQFTALLRKYDRPGPRYTSYPPAPSFSEAFGHKEFEAHIARVRSASDQSEISLYVHLPFCDTLCYFCGCTMLISNNRERIHEYVEYVKREVDLLAAKVGPNVRVIQMHWGGGSPTHLTPNEIEDLALHIRSRFHFTPDAEVSIEIDPRGLTEEHVNALKVAGFNRASIGVQDFEEEVQVAVNRVQPEEMTRQVIAWCRAAGMRSINLDLIYGLPYQTVNTFSNTLEKILSLKPDRIAVYSFAYVPWAKAHQKLIQIDAMPVPDVKIELLKQTVNRFESAGYEYIGMDHFSHQDDELARARRSGTLQRNFQGYSTLAGTDLYGIGMSAISHVAGCYAQNTKSIPEYYAAINEGRLATNGGYLLTPDDDLRAFVISKLMCDLKLSKPEVDERFGVSFDAYFASSLDELEELEEDGLVELSDLSIRVTDLGRFFLRNIAMCFDAHLKQHSKTEKLFSRTV